MTDRNEIVIDYYNNSYSLRNILGLKSVNLHTVYEGGGHGSKSLGYVRGRWFAPPNLRELIQKSGAENVEAALQKLSSATIGLANFDAILDAK